jgi:Uma2 family endonuclease
MVSANRAYEAATELTVQIRDGKYLVPDVGVQIRSAIQDSYPAELIFLCVEVLSPQDRFSEVLLNCDDYLRWGVPVTWIVDPDSRRAWEYRGQATDEIPASGSLTAGDVSVPLRQLFSVLD